MAELIAKIAINLYFLFIGILFIISSYRDKKGKYYPKWFYISTSIFGVLHILGGFTVWLSQG